MIAKSEEIFEKCAELVQSMATWRKEMPENLLPFHGQTIDQIITEIKEASAKIAINVCKIEAILKVGVKGKEE